MTYDKTLQNIVPSQFVLSRDLVLSCEFGMNNQALSFPPQADGINNFLFNIDGGDVGITTNTATGDIKNSLIASDKGAYWNSETSDAIDYSGSIFGTFDVTLSTNRVYENESWVDCGSIIMTNGASLDNCTINGSTATYGCTLDLADSPTISDIAIKNNSGYGMRIDGVGSLTLDHVVFTSNTTKDVYISASSGTVTLNITNGGSTPTYDTAGATVVINNAVSVVVKAITSSGTPIVGARVYLKKVSDSSVILDDVTDVNGEVKDTGWNFPGDTNVNGWVRKSTGSPLYKQGVISGTITSAGFSTNVVMTSDE